MPVNGPGGPSSSPVGGPGSTARSDEPKPATTPAALPAAPTTGWKPRQTGEYAAGGDGFASGPRGGKVSATATPPAVQAKVQQAVDRYQAKVEAILHHDAASLARGEAPFRNGDTLTEAQQKDLQSAATDLLQDIPLGALSPAAAASAQSLLGARGAKVDLQTTSLREVGKLAGDVAGDLAKDLAKQLKGASPAAYYGLAGAAAVAVGAVAYAKGSAGLEKLGIKPELKTGLFNNHVDVKVKASFGEKFSDLALSGEVGARTTLGDHGSVSARAAFDLKGLQSVEANAAYARPDFKLSATARYDVPSESLIAGVAASYQPRPDLNLSASAAYNFRDGSSTAALTATYRPSKNVDFALSGSHDSRGESRVGVGVAIHF
ncbi:MAG: hypothetical protein ACYC8T_25735 [Myxococcaceae bacterium]